MMGHWQQMASFPPDRWIWCLVIGALIILWIVIGITNLGQDQYRCHGIALFILTLVLCKVIFFDGNVMTNVQQMTAMSFGAAVELAVAMPLILASTDQ